MMRSILAVSVAALALTGTALASPAATHATTVKVTAKDYSFALSAKKVKPGRVTFVIKNTGSAVHDFAIAGHQSKTIAPGKTTRLTVMFKKPGRYHYSCTVDSHAELGMKGTLVVAR
jgi:plastocyanin